MVAAGIFRSIRAVAVILAIAITTQSAFADRATSLRALLIEYRCPIVDRLAQIYDAGDPSSHVDRFIAVTVPHHRHGYVQCMFIDKRTGLLCEASSGFYFDKEGAERTFWLGKDNVDALERLGFSTDDSKGNFRYLDDIGARPDFNAIADLILEALHDAYGARANSRLAFDAPFAPSESSSCKPVS